MDLQSDWYPIALADDLEPGGVVGTRLFDAEIVLWRDADRVSHVWEDRCPHRGMRLSFGFMRDNRLGCLYHGWMFDGACQCRAIPAHPEMAVPKAIRARAYASTEGVAGMVWASLADEAAEPPRVEATGAMPVRSLFIECPPDQVRAALAEAVPPPFAAPAETPLALSWPAVGLALFARGDERLLVGVQPLSATQTALHLAVAGAPEIYRGAGQAHFARWGEALRRRLETPVAP
jgi:nitrite reductase/ring-hydroxylating ferredoxin subunit